MSNSNYPNSLDTTANLPDTIIDSDFLSNPDHALLHNTLSDAVLALEAQNIGTVFNVVEYGVIGDNATDNTANLQDLFTTITGLGGGVVFFPPGQYKISDTMTLGTGTIVRGSGIDVTAVIQTSTTAHCFYAFNEVFLTFEQIEIVGPGQGVGSGHGLYLTGDESDIDEFFVSIRNVLCKNWGLDGVFVTDPVMMDCENLASKNNGGAGIYVLDGGTSSSFVACYCFNNTGNGFRFGNVYYSTLIGCGADGNVNGYKLESTCQGISFVGCGAEGNSGDGIQVAGGALGVTISNFYVNNPGTTAIHVTAGSTGVTITGPSGGSNLGTATSFIKVDGSCQVTIISPPAYATANSLTAGTTTIIGDTTGTSTAAATFAAHVINATLVNSDYAVIANTLGDNRTPMAITQNDTTHNPDAMTIVNNATNNGLFINQVGANTVSHYGLFVDTSATQVSSPLLRFRQNNNNSTAPTLQLDNSGTGYALDVNSGNVYLQGGNNLTTSTGTGAMIGLATNEKWAFWGNTPIIQPNGNITNALVNLGLIGIPTGISLAITMATTNFTLGLNNSTLLVSTTATITLPTAVGNTGVEFLVKNTNGGTVSLRTTSGQTIDGNSIAALPTANAFLGVQSDGANWWVVAQAVASIGIL